VSLGQRRLSPAHSIQIPEQPRIFQRPLLALTPRGLQF
jgi:hypothetical protein